MVETNNLTQSIKFYDILFKPVGLIRVDTTNDLIAYAPEESPKSTEFHVCKPFDQNVATYLMD
jgi:hypothetical protein